MQDADQAVAEAAESLMVGVASGAVLVVEGASSWTSGQRTERPLVKGVIEAFVADVTSQHGAFRPDATVNGEVPA